MGHMGHLQLSEEKMANVRGEGERAWPHLELTEPFLLKRYDFVHLQAIPFWIVERAREPKTHSAARLERGEINEKRLGGGGSASPPSLPRSRF